MIKVLTKYYVELDSQTLYWYGKISKECCSEQLKIGSKETLRVPHPPGFNIYRQGKSENMTSVQFSVVLITSAIHIHCRKPGNY